MYRDGSLCSTSRSRTHSHMGEMSRARVLRADGRDRRRRHRLEVLFEDALERGLEGLVVKRVYRHNSMSPDFNGSS